MNIRIRQIFAWKICYRSTHAFVRQVGLGENAIALSAGMWSVKPSFLRHVYRVFPTLTRDFLLISSLHKIIFLSQII